MWYVTGKRLKCLIGLVLFSVLISSCGQPGGSAPSAPPPVPTPTPPIPSTPVSSAILKNGESVTTSGGWTVSFDSTDPVETSVLANGWTVEVLHE